MSRRRRVVLRSPRVHRPSSRASVALKTRRDVGQTRRAAPLRRPSDAGRRTRLSRAADEFGCARRTLWLDRTSSRCRATGAASPSAPHGRATADEQAHQQHGRTVVWPSSASASRGDEIALHEHGSIYAGSGLSLSHSPAGDATEVPSTTIPLDLSGNYAFAYLARPETFAHDVCTALRTLVVTTSPVLVVGAGRPGPRRRERSRPPVVPVRLLDRSQLSEEQAVRRRDQHARPDAFSRTSNRRCGASRRTPSPPVSRRARAVNRRSSSRDEPAALMIRRIEFDALLVSLAVEAGANS